MSRALRRAQKQRIEDVPIKDTESEEEEASFNTTQPINPFNLLDGNDADDMEGDGDDVEQNENLNIPQPAEQASSTNKKHKKKKKKKSKGPNEEIKQADKDDFDDVLAEHAAAIQESVSGQTPKPFDLAGLLAVDIKMLDPNVEMKRIFGSKVVSQDRAERGTRMPKGTQNRGRKSVLVPLEDNYPVTIKGGLEMEMIEDIDGIRTFKFVHSKAYQQAQLMFLQCVQSGDPQTMMNLLTRYPFHVDTLLQVSEILRHQGDNEQAGEMLTRALFAFDRAFHSLFNLATGLVRLPFEYPENRPFYLATYRYIQSLGRRGCWATAFEFNKLLYALAPEEDPYAALLSIDFYAIKARRWEYIDKLLECPWSLVLDEDYPKPNFDYAAGIASFLSDQKGTSKLTEAVKSFPYFVGALFQELKSPGPVQYNIGPSDSFSELLRDLYVFRAKDIYNTPEMIKFMRDTTLPIETFQPYILPPDIPMNISRHILLLDERSLLHYLPKEITSANYLSFDPLPPADSLPSYLDAYLTAPSPSGNTTTSFIPQFIQDMLRQILPNGAGNEMTDAQVAALMQEFEFDDREGQHDDADPNHYGPNRGIDEPEHEGNAGR